MDTVPNETFEDLLKRMDEEKRQREQVRADFIREHNGQAILVEVQDEYRLSLEGVRFAESGTRIYPRRPTITTLHTWK